MGSSVDIPKRPPIKVEILDDVVRKSGPPAILAVEAARTRRAAEVGDESGAFYVPRILRADPGSGVIDFERVRHLRDIAHLALADDLRVPDLVRRAGAALAVIHDRLRLPPDLKIDLPPEWCYGTTRRVFLHGDFNTINVGIDETTGRLVILDWSTAWAVSPMATAGPPCFDLAWFSANLFNIMPWQRVASWPAAAWADLFIKGYLSQCREPPDWNVFRDHRDRIVHIHREIVRANMKGRPWHRRLGRFLIQERIYQLWRKYKPPV